MQEKELLDIDIAPDEHRLLIVGYLKKAEMREVYPDSLRKAKMIRTPDYKLVYRIKDRNELYDLQKDPMEQTNLYDKPEYRELIIKMEKMLMMDEKMPQEKAEKVERAEKVESEVIQKDEKQVERVENEKSETNKQITVR